MSFHIERLPEEKTSRSGIYHRVADKPNGATVKVTGFPVGATKLPEGTLLVEGTGGLYEAIAQVKVVETAAAAAVEYAIAKGSFVKVGTSLIKNGSTNVAVTAVNTDDPSKDVITVDATLGAKAVGDIVTEKVSGTPIGITGEEVAIKQGQNCFTSLWVIAVVNKAIIPEPAVKPAGVLYI